MYFAFSRIRKHDDDFSKFSCPRATSPTPYNFRTWPENNKIEWTSRLNSMTHLFIVIPAVFYLVAFDPTLSATEYPSSLLPLFYLNLILF